MIALFGLVGQIAFSYSLPSTPQAYDIRVDFDGYLPVLGGIEQKARLEFSIELQQKAAGKGFLRLGSFDLSVMDEQGTGYVRLPLSLDSAKEYFPDTNLDFTPLGKILKTDAPDLELPIKLPGLHTRHMPELTVFLLEFPEGGVRPDVPFAFVRNLGGSKVRYEVVHKGRGELGERFDLKVTQDYETWEDENRNPILGKEGARFRVVTHVEGTGAVYMTGPSGRIRQANVTADARSVVYSLEGQKAGDRRLKTSFELREKQP